MICNGSVTIYHKGFDKTKRLEKWTRYNYSKVWFFGGKGAGINKGFDNANDFDCRISYELNKNLDINNFAIGDIVVEGMVNTNITTQDDLKGYLIYKITSITNNKYGINQHIHIGGK